MPPAPAPPPDPLADAIGHYLDRRQAEAIGPPDPSERPTTMRRRLLPVAITAIAVFAPAIALVLVLG
jgi:hypothetical protein